MKLFATLFLTAACAFSLQPRYLKAQAPTTAISKTPTSIEKRLTQTRSGSGQLVLFAGTETPDVGEKTLGGTSRLIAISGRAYVSAGVGYELRDSLHYTWSGGRGSDLNSTTFPYDQSIYYSLAGSALAPSYRVSITYNGSNQPLTQLAQVYDAAGSTWENYQQQAHTYTGGNRTQSVYQEWDVPAAAWENQSRETRVYNAGGSLTLFTIEDWNGSAWDAADQYSYTYTGSGQLSELVLKTYNATTSAWVNDEREQYTYNANGNKIYALSQVWLPSTAAWTNSSKLDWVYAGNNITSEVFSSWTFNSSTWRPFFRRQYTYNTASQPLTELKQNWDAPVAVWKNTGQTLYDYAAGGLLTKTTRQYWDDMIPAFENSNRTFYSYNTNNQLTEERSQGWAQSSNTWEYGIDDNLERYFYETYLNIAGVAAPAGGVLRLYPLPAAGNLNVAVDWNTPQQEGVIMLTDMAGRTLISFALPAGNKARLSLPLGHLPAGNYLLQVGASGQRLSRLVQVAH